MIDEIVLIKLPVPIGLVQLIVVAFCFLTRVRCLISTDRTCLVHRTTSDHPSFFLYYSLPFTILAVIYTKNIPIRTNLLRLNRIE